MPGIQSIHHPRDRQRFHIKASNHDESYNGRCVEYALYRCHRDGGGQEWFVAESICPHSGGPLYQGDIEDGHLICPYHAYRFDLRTGACVYADVDSATDDNGDGNNAVTADDCWRVDRLPVVRYDAISDRLDLQLTHSDSQIILINDGHIDKGGDGSVPLPDISALSLNLTIDGKTSDCSLMSQAIRILQTADPEEKVRLTLQTADFWLQRKIERGGRGLGNNPPVDDSPPPRAPGIKIVQANKAMKLGNAGSLQSRVGILHSLANIEQWAIDLAWDIILRFGCSRGDQGDVSETVDLPQEFLDDFVQVAADEAKHYSMLAERLQELGSKFGDLPIHGGLWESAQQTSKDLLARLAIVHMVHEARGLDVNPATIGKFRRQGDSKTAAILQQIHDDEVTHVARGQKWFSWLCAKHVIDRIERFHSLVKRYFRGPLKPPFNAADRQRAGLDEQFYLPLSL